MEEQKRDVAKASKWYIVKGILKSRIVLIVALVAAAVTCFFVPPDGGYADYFDLDTLSCLFCTLAVVSALKRRRFFEWLATKIVTAFGNMRRVTFALVFVTYFGSMIMANDMALITFLPSDGWCCRRAARQNIPRSSLSCRTSPPTSAVC